MGEINRVLGAEGGGHLVTLADGTRYRLGSCTKTVQACYEAWLEGAIRGKATRALELASADARPARQADLCKVNVDIAAERYAWETPAWADSLQTDAGLIELLHLLLRQHHPDLSRDDAKTLLTNYQEQFGQGLNEALVASRPGGGSNAPNSRLPPQTEATAAA